MTHPMSWWYHLGDAPPASAARIQVLLCREGSETIWGGRGESCKEADAHGGSSYGHQGGGGGGQGTATLITGRKVSRRVMLARHLLPQQGTKSCASSTRRRRVFQEMFTVPPRNAAPCHPSGQGTPRARPCRGPGTGQLCIRHRSIPSFMGRMDKPPHTGAHHRGVVAAGSRGGNPPGFSDTSPGAAFSPTRKLITPKQCFNNSRQ